MTDNRFEQRSKTPSGHRNFLSYTEALATKSDHTYSTTLIYVLAAPPHDLPVEDKAVENGWMVLPPCGNLLLLQIITSAKEVIFCFCLPACQQNNLKIKNYGRILILIGHFQEIFVMGQ